MFLAALGLKSFIRLQGLHSTPPTTQKPFSPVHLIVESSQITYSFLSIKAVFSYPLLLTSLTVSFTQDPPLLPYLPFKTQLIFYLPLRKSPLIILSFKCKFRLGAPSLYSPNTCTQNYHSFCFVCSFLYLVIHSKIFIKYLLLPADDNSRAQNR